MKASATESVEVCWWQWQRTRTIRAW